MKEILKDALMKRGACAVGVARAEEIDRTESDRVRRWINRGEHAGMAWMERHASLRENPENVLQGVRSIVCIAFPYAPVQNRDAELPYISRYAYGRDYHYVLRELITEALQEVNIADQCRICVDSAPLSERYWATKSGIGIRGDNGALIVPGVGPEVFLAEILTTIDLAPDEANNEGCLHCGACRKHCPTEALHSDGTIDCRRCISYLTIEHRGAWEEEGNRAMASKTGKKTLFGCDVCVRVCPLCNPEVRAIPELVPTDETMKLTPTEIPSSKGEFKRRFGNTPLFRTGLDGLRRNTANLTAE